MSAERVLVLVASLSGIFAVGLATVGLWFDSELALAQAADSLVDFAGAVILAWAVRISKAPSDRGHPLGHGRAEPLAALFVAVIAGLLAVEVGRGAIEALLGASRVEPSFTLLYFFAGKVVFKGAVVALTRGSRSPALRALSVDARNDLLVGLVSVVGFALVRAGFPRVDPWLALPVAGWIAFSGYQLARENIDLLMGAAPSQARQAELVEIASSVAQVIDAHDLRAQHLGVELAVHVHVTVSPELTVREAHDIGEAVRCRLEAEDDVVDASVHIDPAGSD